MMSLDVEHLKLDLLSCTSRMTAQNKAKPLNFEHQCRQLKNQIKLIGLYPEDDGIKVKPLGLYPEDNGIKSETS